MSSGPPQSTLLSETMMNQHQQQSSSYDTASPEEAAGPHHLRSCSHEQQQQQLDSHEAPSTAAATTTATTATTATAPTTDIRIDNETMYGWLICKVDGQLVHSVLYGQFSKELLPPTRGVHLLSIYLSMLCYYHIHPSFYADYISMLFIYLSMSN